MFANDYFLAAFIILSFPNFMNEFSLLKCCINVVLGMGSNVIGGILADKYG
jgi:hypothetical protein